MRGRGTPFKPGNKAAVGNGRPPVDEAVKLAKTLNTAMVETLLSKYAQTPEEDLKAIYSTKGLPILEKAFIKCLLLAAQGKLDHLNFVMDRTIGKLQPKVEINQHTYNFDGLPKDKVIELGRQAIEFLESSDE